MLNQEQLQIDRERINAQQETEGARLAIKARADTDKNRRDSEIAGAKLAIDLGKHRESLANQRRQAAQKPPKKGE